MLSRRTRELRRVRRVTRVGKVVKAVRKVAKAYSGTSWRRCHGRAKAGRATDGKATVGKVIAGRVTAGRANLAGKEEQRCQQHGRVKKAPQPGRAQMFQQHIEAAWGKGGAGGKGPADGGKGLFISMEKVLEGFAAAQCLPGQDMGYDDNALHISGLPKDCDDIHLYKLMAPFGSIPPTGIKAMKHPDGTCKGFGFVNYIQPEAMEAAMQMLNGTLLPDGTVMNVTPKQARKEKGGQGK